MIAERICQLKALDAGGGEGETGSCRVARDVAKVLQVRWLESLARSDGDEANLRELLPSRVALAAMAVPVTVEEDGSLVVAIANALNLQGKQSIVREVESPVRWSCASQEVILDGIQKLYGVGAESLGEMGGSANQALSESSFGEGTSVLDDDDSEAAVIRFVNEILRDAIERRATDIHIEPLDDSVRIRHRIDGILREVSVPPDIKELQQMVVARFKVMANLDIAERRLPQDGRIQIEINGQSFDVRLATIPSVEGESVSLRLLGREAFSLSSLGLPDELHGEIISLLDNTNGIIFVTGPTGCGKSTSLYTFLSELNSEERRIVTIEDPVEHKLRGVIQIAVKPEIDLSFAAGLRSVLRGDPNVLMVGEVRDLETAEIAVRAALTGHLVFSTLHTNDAIGGITRLVDMGVEPFLLASSVRAFIAQRLVRRLCVKCRVVHPDPSSIPLLKGLMGAAESTIYEAASDGCDSCGGSGFLGRIAIFEVLKFDGEVAEMVGDSAPVGKIRAFVEKNGFKTLRQYGLEKVIAGETTIGEVIAVTADQKI